MNIPGPIETGECTYQIVDVDLWEQDATLVLNGHRFYFQFSVVAKDRPNLGDALEYLYNERKV